MITKIRIYSCLYKAVIAAFEANSNVVLLVGTDNMPTVGAFFELLLRGRAEGCLGVCSEGVLVISGAYRPHSALGADGPKNIRQAVQLAVNKRSVGRGVLASLNDVFGLCIPLKEDRLHHIRSL